MPIEVCDPLEIEKQIVKLNYKAKIKQELGIKQQISSEIKEILEMEDLQDPSFGKAMVVKELKKKKNFKAVDGVFE